MTSYLTMVNFFTSQDEQVSTLHKYDPAGSEAADTVRVCFPEDGRATAE